MAQMQDMQAAWPQTTQALSTTWYQGRNWGETRDGSKNDAGYWLWIMTEFQRRGNIEHTSKEYIPAVYDRAAANEIRYHWHRQTQFQKPTQALGKCVLNIIGDRPEKLETAFKFIRSQTPAQSQKPKTNYELSLGNIIPAASLAIAGRFDTARAGGVR